MRWEKHIEDHSFEKDIGGHSIEMPHSVGKVEIAILMDMKLMVIL